MQVGKIRFQIFFEEPTGETSQITPYNNSYRVTLY